MQSVTMCQSKLWAPRTHYYQLLLERGRKGGSISCRFWTTWGARGLAPHTTTPTVTAALTDTSPMSEITLALITDVNSDNPLLSKDTPLYSDGGDVLEVHSHGEVLLALRDCILESFPEGTWNHMTYALMATTGSGPCILTYADSAANKHCFVEWSDFTTYFPLSKPDEGQPANKGGQFRIIGHGAVMKTIVSGSLRTTTTFKNAVHTPDLIANLVSISMLDAAGCWTLFGGGGVKFCDLVNGNQRLLMKGEGTNGMYLSNVPPPTTALVSQYTQKSASLDVWHRRLGHVGVTSILEMAKKGVIDGLDIIGDVEVQGKCKDCIYGKQTARPYDEVTEHGKNILEWVYIDLWGPVRVRSTRGAKYMMVFNDGGSSFRQGYFLGNNYC